MKELITGIQQVGIGVINANEAKNLYKDLFGMDVLIFEDKAEASLMTKYTGTVRCIKGMLSFNEPFRRRRFRDLAVYFTNTGPQEASYIW